MIYDGDIIEKAGRKFRVDIEADADADPPWLSCDGHGVVSDWVTRSKRPGELVLCTGHHGDHRFYDAQASKELATKDGWGLGAEALFELIDKLGREPTKKEITKQAVEKDFDFLSGYCNQRWWYVGVVITDVTDDPKAEIDYGYALWGIESDAYDHHEEVAHDLIDRHLAVLAKDNEAKQLAAEAHREEHPLLYQEMEQLIEHYGAELIEQALTNLGWLP